MAGKERLLELNRGEASNPRRSSSSGALDKCLSEILKDSPEFRMAQDNEPIAPTTPSPPPPPPKDDTLKKKEAGDDDDRETWSNQFQFFFYCLGYAVGFGNVWRFPYLCYKNGGAAFLIPYFIMLVCAGIPIFCLELTIGQYLSLGPATLYPKLAPVMSGLGWGMVVIPLLTAIYFNVILAWTFFYTFASFNSVLPWGNCDNDFNTPACYTEEDGAECRNQSLFYYDHSCLNASEYCQLGALDDYNATHCYNPEDPDLLKPVENVVYRMTSSEDYFRNRMLGVSGRTWDDMGGLRWELVGCLALGWVIVGACLAKGIRTTGKIVYFTAIFPYVILIILLARGLTLDGAYQGLEFYLLKPNMTRLTEMEVWSDAAVQIFFSLGICFGCLVTLSSYNKFSNNCVRDAFVLAFSNCCTSILIGLVIFSVLGFLAKELGVEVGEVATSGSGLAFVVFPAALSLMPFPQIWSILFFVMLMNIGFGSQFTMVETVTTAIVDQFGGLRNHKGQVVIWTCLAIFLMGLTMCLEGGIYMFELFFFFSAGLSVIVLGLVQLIGVQSIFGYRNMMTAMREMGIDQPRILTWYWGLTWLFVTPVALIMIAFFTLYFTVPAYWGDYVFPYHIQVLGWLLCSSSMVCIPIGVIYAIIKNKGNYRNIYRSLPDFCPASVRQLLKAKEEVETANGDRFRYTSHHNDAFVVTEKEKFDTPE